MFLQIGRYSKDEAAVPSQLKAQESYSHEDDDSDVPSSYPASNTTNQHKYQYHQPVIPTDEEGSYYFKTHRYLRCRDLQQDGSGTAATLSQSARKRLVQFRIKLEYEFQQLPSELGLFVLVTAVVLACACTCFCVTVPILVCYEYFFMYQIDREIDLEEMAENEDPDLFDIKSSTDDDSASTVDDSGESLSVFTES